MPQDKRSEDRDHSILDGYLRYRYDSLSSDNRERLLGFLEAHTFDVWLVKTRSVRKKHQAIALMDLWSAPANSLSEDLMDPQHQFHEASQRVRRALGYPD